MAWSVLQSAGNTKTGGQPFTATYGSNMTAGTKMIAYIASGTTPAHTITSVTDSHSSQFTLAARQQLNSNGNGHLDIWVLDTPGGDVGTKPVISAASQADAGATASILLHEVSGLKPGASCLDGTAGLLFGAGGTSAGSPAYSSTAAGEFLVTVYGDNGGPSTWTGPGGWTTDSHSVNSSGVDDIAVAYKNSTGGAESGAGWALTASGQQWAVILVAFKLGWPLRARTPVPVFAASLGGVLWR